MPGPKCASCVIIALLVASLVPFLRANNLQQQHQQLLFDITEEIAANSIHCNQASAQPSNAHSLGWLHDLWSSGQFGQARACLVQLMHPHKAQSSLNLNQQGATSAHLWSALGHTFAAEGCPLSLCVCSVCRLNSVALFLQALAWTKQISAFSKHLSLGVSRSKFVCIWGGG